MARPREFDDQAVLNAAMECFWRHGYEATSVRDLSASTGLSAPSLYNAFGDKRALFEKTLRHYLAEKSSQRIAHLEHLPPRQAISTFFDEAVASFASEEGRRGCFLINSVMAGDIDDAELADLMKISAGTFEDFLRRHLERGCRDGAIVSDIAPEDGARMLVGVFLGLRVAARFRPQRVFLKGMVAPALTLLLGASPHSVFERKT